MFTPEQVYQVTYKQYEKEKASQQIQQVANTPAYYAGKLCIQPRPVVVETISVKTFNNIRKLLQHHQQYNNAHRHKKGVKQTGTKKTEAGHAGSIYKAPVYAQSYK